MAAKIGLVGGTGYTGVELLRLLATHPRAQLAVITSRSEKGVRVDEMFPNLRGHVDLEFTEPDVKALSECDLVFYATPNGVAMRQVPELLQTGVKVVDLAADFRLKSVDDWAHWYGEPHTCAEILEQAVYGLPEMHREAIKSAQLVANPGCYPTAVQLGYLPLLENELVDTQGLIADCKSGASGAGRGGKVSMLLCEVNESFKAYGAPGHRHLPEIKQGLNEAANTPVQLTFVPHLIPMTRGIHATLYSRIKNQPQQGWQALFEERYRDEPFVDVMPAGSHPETRTIRGTNMCRIAVHQPQGEDTLVVLSIIDNLVKGAAGQAIQNMNLMLGYPEQEGLNQVALLP